MVDRTPGLAVDTGDRMAEIKEKALDFAATAREQWSERSRTLKDYIVNEPLRALGIALGMGVVLGWLIKRR